MAFSLPVFRKLLSEENCFRFHLQIVIQSCSIFVYHSSQIRDRQHQVATNHKIRSLAGAETVTGHMYRIRSTYRFSSGGNYKYHV